MSEAVTAAHVLKGIAKLVKQGHSNARYTVHVPEPTDVETLQAALDALIDPKVPAVYKVKVQAGAKLQITTGNGRSAVAILGPWE